MFITEYYQYYVRYRLVSSDVTAEVCLWKATALTPGVSLISLFYHRDSVRNQHL